MQARDCKVQRRASIIPGSVSKSRDRTDSEATRTKHFHGRQLPFKTAAPDVSQVLGRGGEAPQFGKRHFVLGVTAMLTDVCFVAETFHIANPRTASCIKVTAFPLVLLCNTPLPHEIATRLNTQFG